MALTTLFGQYGVADSTKPEGYLDILPMVTAVNAGVIVTQAPVHVELADGAFSVEILASDDPSWASGEPMPYIFREFINGQVSQWMAYVYGTDPVDIKDLVQLGEAPAFPPPEGIPPGGIAGQILFKTSDLDYAVGWKSGLVDWLGWIGPVVDGSVPPGGGGTMHHGSLEGLEDDDHPQYQLLNKKNQTNGYVGLDGSGRQVGQYLFNSQTNDYPENTAGGYLANLNYVNAQAVAAGAAAINLHEAKANPHPVYAPATHTHPSTSANREFLWKNPMTGAPAAGYVVVESTGGSNRTIRVSKTDADGIGYTLATMLPGDTVVITDDPDSPPITGFARYVITSDLRELTTYWEFDALRTDTSGSQTAPADGTRVRFLPTMAAGAPAELAGLPFYGTNKVQNVQGIKDLWTAVVTLNADPPAGVYETGFAVSWIADDPGSSLILRDRNNGGTWSTYAQEAGPLGVTYFRSFFFQYPKSWAGGTISVELEAKRDGAGSIDIKYADLWTRRVQ